MGEFDLIDTYFRWNSDSALSEASGVVTGIGDDAAVLQLENNQQLVTSIDTLISGVHFPKETPADAIAHKALSVNLSDLAAMGAEAKWFTLALTLPSVDHVWLKQFSTCLRNLAEKCSVQLVGGDTTKGPLSISIQVMGTVEKGQSLLRSGAKPGDKIFVTGTLGDAAVGLASVQGRLSLSNEDKNYCEGRLNYPTARLEESKLIKQYATSCIDVSDGLLQDLGHILKKSHVSAMIDLARIPLSDSLQKLKEKLSSSQVNDYALKGGDDYELVFTIAAEDQQEFINELPRLTSTKISMIGHISGRETDKTLHENEVGNIKNIDGTDLVTTGYNHFEDDDSALELYRKTRKNDE